MRRNNNRRFRYDVDPGEIVTFDITPIGTGGLITATQNGISLENSGSDSAPKFSFTASIDSDSLHFVMIEFSFVGEDSENAKYEIRLSGSQGGSFNDFRPITARSPIKDPIFRFKVN